MKTLPRLISFVPLAVMCLSSADAAILLTENFTDGNLTGGADNSGIAWYDRSGSTVLSILDDPSPGFDTGNALMMARTSGSIANRGIVGVLSQGITLSNPGDTVTLSFSFRFTTTDGSISPFNAGEGLTFGFYNSNGTVVSTNDSTVSDNDFGYRAEFGSGANSRIGIAREVNGSGGGLGTNTDGVQMTVIDPVTVSIGDFLPHTGSITLTYNSPTEMGISVSYNGNVVGTATNNAPITTFDEVVFSQGGGNGFLLDNVVVTSNVPEPGSAALVGLGGVLCVAGYRRRK